MNLEQSLIDLKEEFAAARQVSEAGVERQLEALLQGCEKMAKDGATELAASFYVCSHKEALELTEALRRLEQAGFVVRFGYTHNGASLSYDITVSGWDLLVSGGFGDD